jgi:hypothetical protein
VLHARLIETFLRGDSLMRVREKDTRLAEEVHAMPRKKVEEEVPKIAPISGYLRVQYVKCGRPNCQCSSTKGHGPYYYRVITVEGQKRKIYVKKAELAAVQAGMDEHRRQRAETRRMYEVLKNNGRKLRQLFRFMR